jgi:endonuclease/exonuclease/phosphatase family metal-dependent hydrolase
LRLLSWNVQWCRGIDGRVDPKRIAAEAKRLADPDVFCLQEIAVNFPEMAGSAGEDQVELLAAEFQGYEAFFAPGVDIPGKRGRRQFGNLILTRLPAGRVMRHQLPWPALADRQSMARAAAEVVVEAPFGPLRVMTTHLEYYSPTQRAAQVEALRAHHVEACGHAFDDRARSDSGDPFQAQPHTVSAILTGDFNLRPEDPLHARMTAPSAEPRFPAFADAWQFLHPGRPQPPTLGVHDRDQWPDPFACDFIFATRDLCPRLRNVAVDATTAASDHQPVLVELG